MKVLVRPSELPREVHDEADRMIRAAVAEAGYPAESVWDPAWNAYAYTADHVPWPVRDKAVILVCDRLGIPYKVLEDEENWL